MLIKKFLGLAEMTLGLPAYLNGCILKVFVVLYQKIVQDFVCTNFPLSMEDNQEKLFIKRKESTMSALKLELRVGPSLGEMQVCNVESKNNSVAVNGFTDISIMVTMIKVSFIYSSYQEFETLQSGLKKKSSMSSSSGEAEFIGLQVREMFEADFQKW